MHTIRGLQAHSFVPLRVIHSEYVWVCVHLSVYAIMWKHAGACAFGVCICMEFKLTHMLCMLLRVHICIYFFVAYILYRCIYFHRIPHIGHDYWLIEQFIVCLCYMWYSGIVWYWVVFMLECCYNFDLEKKNSLCKLLIWHGQAYFNYEIKFIRGKRQRFIHAQKTAVNPLIRFQYQNNGTYWSSRWVGAWVGVFVCALCAVFVMRLGGAPGRHCQPTFSHRKSYLYDRQYELLQ